MRGRGTTSRYTLIGQERGVTLLRATYLPAAHCPTLPHPTPPYPTQPHPLSHGVHNRKPDCVTSGLTGMCQATEAVHTHSAAHPKFLSLSSPPLEHCHSTHSSGAVETTCRPLLTPDTPSPSPPLPTCCKPSTVAVSLWSSTPTYRGECLSESRARSSTFRV